MGPCANTYYLNKYLQEQEKLEREDEENYYQMTEELRNEDDVDEYENIIDSYGYSDLDIIDIISGL